MTVSYTRFDTDATDRMSWPQKEEFKELQEFEEFVEAGASRIANDAVRCQFFLLG